MYTCFSSGRADQEDSSTTERVPHFIHGHHNSGVLPFVLDALWGCCDDGHVWTSGDHHTHCERGAIPPCQKQHSHQPCYLHPYEQTGLTIQTFSLALIQGI